jgi:hypothetical protein
MNAKRILRSFVWLAGGVVLLSIPAASTTLEACGESGACEQLRQTEYANLSAWQNCDPEAVPSQCLPIAGNAKDCTGVLACDFAVNATHRADAEWAVLVSGQQSQGCYLCATPNCVGGNIAYCEPTSHRCDLATAILDGGVITVSPEDSGAPSTSHDSGSPPVDAAPE